jgi:hypothetical protein
MLAFALSIRTVTAIYTIVARLTNTLIFYTLSVGTPICTISLVVRHIPLLLTLRTICSIVSRETVASFVQRTRTVSVAVRRAPNRFPKGRESYSGFSRTTALKSNDQCCLSWTSNYRWWQGIPWKVFTCCEGTLYL